MDTDYCHNIFAVDDDQDDLYAFREVVRDVLPEHKVLAFSNGQELLQYLAGIRIMEFPCLIVLDINMPVLNGKETLQRLKESDRFRNIPVVLFTTSSSHADIAFAESYGTPLMTKPPSFLEMLAVIKNMGALCKPAQECL